MPLDGGTAIPTDNAPPEAHTQKRCIKHNVIIPTAQIQPNRAQPYYPYDRTDWYFCGRVHCRDRNQVRMRDADPNANIEEVWEWESGHACYVCAEENNTVVEHQYRHRAWVPACGRCHADAKERYPEGHQTCRCHLKLVTKTCKTCVDTKLWRWETCQKEKGSMRSL